MKVTLDIPDDLHRRLKIKATLENTTMRALILRGIEVDRQSKAVKAAGEEPTEAGTVPSD